MIAGRKLGLYADAVRHAQARQLIGRLRRGIPPRLLAAGLDSSPTSWLPLAAGTGARSAPQSGPVPHPHEAGVFCAVGRSRRFGSPAFWTDQSDGLLMLFHLHGFEELARYAAGQRGRQGDEFWADVARSWVATNGTPDFPAWHPYPTSNRIVAWCAALSAIDGWPTALRERLASETLRQARYLFRAVEHDIGGNHVIRNGVALVVAGTVFSSKRLLGKGLRVLETETGRQVLPDGGHEERSTSYHGEVLEDLCHVAAVLDRSGVREPDWLSVARTGMADWTEQLRGPDGRLPLLNDAWEGPVSPRRREAPISRLADSGYLVLRDGRDQLIFDAGPLSPPHLPPHAHADALSFVLWADGEQVVVDPGAFAYTGPHRAEFRATRAHNTAEVDGEDQCVFWGDFRLAHPPAVRAIPPRRHDGVVVAGGCHDGYRRLDDPVQHLRNVVWWPGQGVVVVDLLRSARSHDIRSKLQLAAGTVTGRGGRVGPFVVRTLAGRTPLEATTGLYAPYLGTAVPAPVLETALRVSPEAPFGWSLLRPGARVSALERDRLVLADDDREIHVPLTWKR